jgi:hypothetical protein
VAAHLMDPARVDREEPAWAAQLERRHGPVQGPGAWRRLLRAIVADVGAHPVPSAAELRGVRVPILMAYGDRDVFCPADHAVRLYRALPDARLFMAPDCGHQVMVSRPGLFNEAAAGFYRETARQAEARATGLLGTDAQPSRAGGRAPVPLGFDAADDPGEATEMPADGAPEPEGR